MNIRLSLLIIFLLSSTAAHARGEFIFRVFGKQLYKHSFALTKNPSFLDNALRYCAYLPFAQSNAIADETGISTNEEYLEEMGHELLEEVEVEAASKVHTALAQMGVENANKIPVYQFTKTSPIGGLLGCTDSHEICLHKDADLFTIYHEAAHFALEHSKKTVYQGTQIKMNFQPNFLSCAAVAAGIGFTNSVLRGETSISDLSVLFGLDMLAGYVALSTSVSASKKWHDPSEGFRLSKEIEADRLAAETLIRHGNLDAVRRRVKANKLWWLYLVEKMKQEEKSHALRRNDSEIPGKSEMVDLKKKISEGEVTMQQKMEKAFGDFRPFKELACRDDALEGFYTAVENAIHKQKKENDRNIQKLFLKVKDVKYPKTFPSDSALSSINIEMILNDLKDKKFGETELE